MSRRRTNTYIVVAIKAILIGVDRVQRTMAPRVQQVSTLVVRVSGRDSAEARIIAAHLTAAALAGGALALASSLTTGPVSAALELAGELSVGVIAVHAAIRLVQVRSGSSRGVRERELARAALAHVVGRRTRPVLRAAALLREHVRARRSRGPEPRLVEWTPGGHEALIDVARDAGRFLLKPLLERGALRLAKRALPGLGNALALMGTYRTTLDSARYVHQFALSAVESHPALPEAA